MKKVVRFEVGRNGAVYVAGVFLAQIMWETMHAMFRLAGERRGGRRVAFEVGATKTTRRNRRARVMVSGDYNGRDRLVSVAGDLLLFCGQNYVDVMGELATRKTLYFSARWSA